MFFSDSELKDDTETRQHNNVRKRAADKLANATLAPVKSFLEDIYHARENNQLNLAGKTLTIQDLELIPTLIYSRNLFEAKPITTINLSKTGLTLAHLDSLNVIFKQAPSCLALDVSENNLGGEGAKKILEFIANTQIRHVNFNKINATNMNVNVVFELIQQNDFLNQIDFSANAIPEQLYQLSTLLSQHNCKTKIIGGLNIHNDSSNTQAAKKRRIDHAKDSNSHRPGFPDNNGKVEIAAKQNNNPAELLIKKSLIKCRELITEERKEQISNLDNYQDVNVNLVDNMVLDGRFRTNCRASNSNLKIIYDHRFISFNISEILDGYFICEGPDPDDKSSFGRFCNALFEYETLASVSTLLAVGLPSNGEKYFDYITAGELTAQGYSITAVQIAQEPHIKTYDFKLERESDNKIKSLRLINIRGRLKDKLCLEDLDKLYLYKLALTLDPKNILAHCDTGIGPSACILFSFYLFRYFHEIFIGPTSEIIVNIDKKLQELRINNSSFLPTREMIVSAINLALDYMELHCKNLKENKAERNIHKLAKIKSVMLIGKVTESDEVLNYLKLKLQDLGIHVYVLNLSYEPAKIKTDFKPIIELDNYFNGDEAILTTFTLETAKRQLAQRVSAKEVDAIIIYDEEIPSKMLTELIKTDYQIPKICLITNSSLENNGQQVQRKNTNYFYLEESNANNSKDIYDQAIASTYGHLLLSEKNSLSKSAEASNPANHVVFCSPLKSYSTKIVESCENALVHLGYIVDKFLTDDKDATQKIDTFLSNQNTNLIIEIPTVEINNSSMWQLRYINKIPSVAKKMHYIIILGGIDYVEGAEEIVSRRPLQYNNRYIYPITTDEIIPIMQIITARIQKLITEGNQVDVVIPNGLSQYDRQSKTSDVVRLGAIKKALGYITLKQNLGIHEVKAHIDDIEFVTKIIELAKQSNGKEKMLSKFFSLSAQIGGEHTSIGSDEIYSKGFC